LRAVGNLMGGTNLRAMDARHCGQWVGVTNLRAVDGQWVGGQWVGGQWVGVTNLRAVGNLMGGTNLRAMDATAPFGVRQTSFA